MGNQWVSRSFVCNLHRMYENVACTITVDIVVHVLKSLFGCFKTTVWTVVRVGWFLIYPGWHNQSTPAQVPCDGSTCMHSSQTIVPLLIPMNKIQNNPCLYFPWFYHPSTPLVSWLSIFFARSEFSSSVKVNYLMLKYPWVLSMTQASTVLHLILRITVPREKHVKRWASSGICLALVSLAGHCTDQSGEKNSMPNVSGWQALMLVMTKQLNVRMVLCNCVKGTWLPC